MGLIIRNLREFEQFRAKVAEAPYLVPVLANLIGVAFMKETQEGFRRGVTPYDQPWKPVFRNRKRDRRARVRRAAKGLPPKADKPLVDTGRLRASVVARTEGSMVRIALPVEYASYHQYGTSRIPRRQILPEADTGGLGERWSLAASREAIGLLNRHLEKK